MASFWKLKFPLYPLNAPNLTVEGPLTLMEATNGKYKLIDDKRMPGATLGIRRLQHCNSETPVAGGLYTLKYPVFTLGELSKRPGGLTYIDSAGLIIKYIKSEFHRVYTYRISKFVEHQEGYVIHVLGVHCRFFLPRAPELHETHIQLIRVGLGYVLYDLTSAHAEPIRRKL